MDEIQMTRDSKELLAIIYKEYLQNINNGIDKRTAKFISGGSDEISELAPTWLYEDVKETMYELERKDLLICQNASNKIYRAWITDELIIYMETVIPRTVKKILSVADILSFLK
ncbi:hypothetical protein LKF67_1268 [Lactococcus lactis subsp. lactis]|uniref:hypothetical protein n=1 Tax=Lactococcus lactis TaxID=1358 RepID=UPI00071E5532|nr:hypothetical protein [Lactococcus lactis]KST91680.1 hypothetical protein LKF67_1268 [Lactococcus lactis subsp. lactis]